MLDIILAWTLIFILGNASFMASLPLPAGLRGKLLMKLINEKPAAPGI